MNTIDELIKRGATLEQVTCVLLSELEEKEAEIERLKIVPMKYRRMAFNAQLQDENNELREQLAAAQLQIKTLREALELIATGEEVNGCIPSLGWAVDIADNALSTPQDLSALLADRKRIADAVERMTVERCAAYFNNAANITDKDSRAGVRNIYIAVAATIRALPLGQIDIEELGK